MINIIKYIFRKQMVKSDEFHLNASLKWLESNHIKNNGFAKKYNFLTGIDKSYPETTGYIISSLINYSLTYKTNKYDSIINESVRWLISIQNKDGSFNDTSNTPQVFDTGQIILGLTCAYNYLNKPKKIYDSIDRACNFLIRVQSSDGSFHKFSYNKIKHTYYSRVAWALLEAYKITKKEAYKISAIKNLDWVLSMQEDNGYFKCMSFDKKQYPYLHTMIYVLEGLLESYKITKESKYKFAVIKTVSVLLEISKKRDFILRSQYKKDFSVANSQKCIPGLIQFAGLCVDLYDYEKDEKYITEAKKILAYVKSKQILDNTSKKVYGGFCASIPFYGRYGRFEIVNWNNKFFIDLILKIKNYNIEENELDVYISERFNFFSKKRYSEENIEQRDEKILHMTKQYIKGKVLDLGCGKGKIVKYLKNKGVDIIGVDPAVEYLKNAELNLLKADVYDTKLKANSVDTILLIEVLQHVPYIDKAFLHIKNIIKDGGHILVVERNKISIMQILKPFMEKLDLWMYPSDSPFFERSMYKKQWIELFAKLGPTVFVRKISGDGKIAKHLNKYYVFVIKVDKSK